PRKNKALLVVVGAENPSWDQAKLRKVAQNAKCKGVAVFVVAVGEHYNRAQVAELASTPLDQHLICLGHLRVEEQGYTQRFIRTYLSVLNKGLNTYPPVALKKSCDLLDEQKDIFEQGQVGVKDIIAGQEQFEEQTGRRTETHVGQVDLVGSVSTGRGGVLVQRPKPNSCGGNSNRFKTQEDCENLCLTKSQ
ncbi:hypothetical protein CRUP_007648, partial [Coryphaenoides rupestris]